MGQELSQTFEGKAPARGDPRDAFAYVPGEGYCPEIGIVTETGPVNLMTEAEMVPAGIGGHPEHLRHRRTREDPGFRPSYAHARPRLLYRWPVAPKGPPDDVLRAVKREAEEKAAEKQEQKKRKTDPLQNKAKQPPTEESVKTQPS